MIDHMTNFFALPCSAMWPPGTCKTKYPQKKIPAANPETVIESPKASFIPPAMAKLIFTRSM